MSKLKTFRCRGLFVHLQITSNSRVSITPLACSWWFRYPASQFRLVVYPTISHAFRANSSICPAHKNFQSTSPLASKKLASKHHFWTYPEIYRSNLEYGNLPVYHPQVWFQWSIFHVEVVNICYQTGFYSKMATVRKPFKQTQAIFFSAIHLPIKWADFL